MLMISECLRALGASRLIVPQYFRCVTSPGFNSEGEARKK